MPFCRDCGKMFSRKGARRTTLCLDCWLKIMRKSNKEKMEMKEENEHLQSKYALDEHFSKKEDETLGDKKKKAYDRGYHTAELKESKRLDLYNLGFKDAEREYKKDVKEFIKQGDKIFYSKDYGNDNVSNEEYDYAVKKWEEFKKLAGEKLLK